MAAKRTYTKQFKIDAVELADTSGNAAQTARDLGIHPNMIYKWRAALKEAPSTEKAFPGKGTVRDAKMASMRRRIDQLEEENAILKKAIGIFSTAPMEQRPR
jgi:transposase